MNASEDTPSPHTPDLKRSLVMQPPKRTPMRRNVLGSLDMNTLATPIRAQSTPQKFEKTPRVTPVNSSSIRLSSESFITPSPHNRKVVKKKSEEIADFKNYYDNEELSDVTLVLRCQEEFDIEVHAHTIILSQSEVFASMIRKERTRSETTPVRLKINLNQSQLKPFCIAVQHLYGYQLLPRAISQVVSLLDLSKMYGLSKLAKECVKSLRSASAQDVESFLKSEAFCALRIDQVVEFLSSDDIPIENEVLVYESVCEYLKTNPSADPVVLKSVIKFPLLPSSIRLEQSPFEFTTEQRNELQGASQEGNFSFSPKQYSKRHAHRKFHGSESYLQQLAFSSRRTESPNTHNKTPPLMLRFVSNGVNRVLELDLEEREDDKLKEFLLFQIITFMATFVIIIIFTKFRVV